MEIRELLQGVYARQRGFEQAKQVYAPWLAPSFNPLTLLDLNELKISRILAWMLDPNETHCQGSIFFNLLLEQLDVHWPIDSLKTAIVKTEVWIADGRIDIEARVGKKIVAIENKPWANDTDTQLARYLRHLDSYESGSCLIYLTPDGSFPGENSLDPSDRDNRISRQQLRLMSYRQSLRNWLAQCRVVCKADRVSSFIDQFSSYIDWKFGGWNRMAEQAPIVDQTTESNEAVSAAMDIIFSANAIRDRLLSKLQRELSSLAIAKAWRVRPDERPPGPERYAGFFIELKDSPLAFGFEFQYPQFNGLIFGIYKQNRERADDQHIKEVTDTLGPGKANQYWAWYRTPSPTDDLLPTTPNWGDNKQPWIAISDGSMATHIVHAAERLLALVKMRVSAAYPP